MRIVRISHQGKEKWGSVFGKKIRLFKDAPYSRILYTKETIAFCSAALLSPVTPSKIILVGLNYTDHAKELGMPLPKVPIIFLKPLTALIGHGDAIVYPQGVRRLDFEAELAVVIKKEGRSFPPKKAKDYILGYTCLNDVTARDIQKKDGQWTRAKSFDTFCPVGPWIETDFNPSRCVVQSYLNGKLKQSSPLKNLIFSIPYLVSFISRVMTLKTGDVISTGTPSGVGLMKPNDEIEVAISGIGCLKNRVVVQKH